MILTLLLACTSPDLDLNAAVTPAEGQQAPPLPQTLTLRIADPLAAGWPMDVVVTGAAPNARLKLVRSTGTIGAGVCPAGLGGGCLGITQGGGYALLDLRADATGRATLPGDLPTTVPDGMTVAFQAVDIARAVASNPLVRTTGRPPCVDDAQEQNDTFATARPGLNLSGNTCPNDDDFYSFTLPAGMSVKVQATFDEAGDGNIDLDLYDATHGLASAFRTPFGEEVRLANRGAGNMALAARIALADATLFDPDHGAPTGALYDVDVTFEPATVCAPDALEPNDSQGAAVPLSLGVHSLTSCQADGGYDWYTIALTAGQRLTVRVDGDNEDGDVNMALYPPAGGRSLVEAWSTDDVETLTYVAPTSGTYTLATWVMILDYDTPMLEGVGYDMTVTAQ